MRKLKDTRQRFNAQLEQDLQLEQIALLLNIVQPDQDVQLENIPQLQQIARYLSQLQQKLQLYQEADHIFERLLDVRREYALTKDMIMAEDTANLVLVKEVQTRLDAKIGSGY